jgi:hypothetical protein
LQNRALDVIKIPEIHYLSFNFGSRYQPTAEAADGQANANASGKRSGF